MYYVYLIQSLKNPSKKYVGYTTDLKKRLQRHNSGSSFHTKQDKPWKIVMCLCFENRTRAIEFEKYLKSGSGIAFAKKRLW